MSKHFITSMIGVLSISLLYSGLSNAGDCSPAPYVHRAECYMKGTPAPYTCSISVCKQNSMDPFPVDVRPVCTDQNLRVTNFEPGTHTHDCGLSGYHDGVYQCTVAGSHHFHISFTCAPK